MHLNNFSLVPTRLGNAPAFRLDNGTDSLLLTAADLEQLRHAIDAVVPHVHNTEPCDPDAHVMFDSVCCGATLYRCTAVQDGVPCKPIIRQGEDVCRSCGADLIPF